MGDSMGEALAMARRRAGFTQETLAERLGITQETVSRIERGQRPPPWRYVVRLAEVLHVSPYGLLVKTGYIPREEDMDEIMELAATVPEFAYIAEYARRHPEAVHAMAQYVRFLESQEGRDALLASAEERRNADTRHD